MQPNLLRVLSPLLMFTTAACATDIQVPEATTDTVPAQGGVLLSADGLFGLKAGAQADASELSIITRHDLQVSGVISKVYEVQSSNTSMRFEEVYYDVTALDSPESKVLVTVDDDDVQMVATHWDINNQRLLSVGIGIKRRLFAVLELGYRNGDCSNRLCNASCTFCDPDSEICRPQAGRCDLSGECTMSLAPMCYDGVDGWDDGPGTGQIFVINQLAVSGESRGFDIDGACDNATGCVDNILWRLGELANDQIRQSLLGGEILLLVELAGLNTPYRGDDESLTLKMYGGSDADDPIFPANNFGVPPGETECCQFNINPQGLSGLPPQARARAPSRVEQGRLRSLAPLPISVTTSTGAPLFPELRLERALVSGRLPSQLDAIDEGLLGGAISVSSLAQMDNPNCRVLSPRCPEQFTDSSLLDLVSILIGPKPDVDLDFDGLECVSDTDGDGRIDRCCDGETNACSQCSHPIPPLDTTRPESCALDPRMADGYSIGFTFTAVPAEIVGVAGR